MGIKNMFNFKKILTITFLILGLTNFTSAQTFAQEEINYPDYATFFVGEDKYEKFNRKIFNFNMKMNKYALRPLHIIWASIMPKYGMDRIQGVYENILYPKRLVSTLIQKDFKGAKNETLRFLTNTTLGLGGMFDPARRYFDLNSTDADMEQALAKCNVKSGPYLVCPILSASTPRALAGKALDAALDPSSYVGLPFMSFVKAGLTLNNSYSMQPITYLIEETYADPYDIIKKLYGLENHLKTSPPVEKEVMKTMIDVFDSETGLALTNISPEYLTDVSEKFVSTESGLASSNIDENIYTLEQKQNGFEEDDDDFAQKILALYGFSSMLEDDFFTNVLQYTPMQNPQTELSADIILENYNPQNPVTDAMRTVLFDMPEINNSIWSEFSIWNRSFSKRIKTSSVNLFPEKENYKFRYIMQKDKNAPVAIIYPSIGEGIMSNHSVVMAKIFYDKGYSVIIQGSHFQWAFVKSMPESYKPGLPSQDTDYLRLVTTTIINHLQEKYNCEFKDKIVIGTSFGAMTTLFLADKEQKDNTLNISKFIAINPPIDLVYAMTQIDTNTAQWHKNPDNLKERVANTASKVLTMLQDETIEKDKVDSLPFSEEEAKFITGFIMHQKLSDLIYTIEKIKNKEKINPAELYAQIRKMNYQEYAKKYLLENKYTNIEELSKHTSLNIISTFLESNNNYVIYHSLDDYLVNPPQLSTLKNICGNNLILFNNGSHLGFLYRKEFINSLKNQIPELSKNNDELDEELTLETLGGI